jgi:hypothetical protein
MSTSLPLTKEIKGTKESKKVDKGWRYKRKHFLLNFSWPFPLATVSEEIPLLKYRLY